MLSAEDIIEFNRTILGNSYPKKDLLNSALSSYYYYDSIEYQIASIVRGIIKNHPFLDANKRTAVLTLFYLSEMYNLKIPSDDKLFDIITHMASSNESVETISSMLFVK